jgi:hypothetical protein
MWVETVSSVRHEPACEKKCKRFMDRQADVIQVAIPIDADPAIIILKNWE